jgi:serine/threonine protein kinase
MSADAPVSFPSWRRVSPGTRLNSTYEIDQLIRSGGMGEVYKGRQIATGHQVAIKMLLPELESDEAALKLFFTEASVLFDIQHDAIVRYYSFAKDPLLGRYFLAMEFVDGRDLSAILGDGPLKFEAVWALLQRLASGLLTVHEHGIVHRDVSPENILIPNGDVGRAKLIDFGIVRSNQHGTVIGSGFAGKYSYVSPEQLGQFGGNVTSKSDIYSLGLVIVEALTGRSLDMGGSPFDAIEKRRRLPNLGAIDIRIRPLLDTMLQPDPEQRPEATAVVVALGLQSAQEPRQKRKSFRPRPNKVGRRRWAFAALLLLALVGYNFLVPASHPRMTRTSETETNTPFDRIEMIRRFILQYNGGDCFFVTPVPGAIGESAAVIEGLGSSKKPFDAFDQEFERQMRFAATIEVRLVTEKQCPAINFLSELRGQIERAPRLEIDEVSIRSGDVLTGVVDHYGTNNVDLILVLDSGTILNVSNHMRLGTSAKTFDIKMVGLDGAPGRQPQLLVALAGPSPVDALQPGQSAEAGQFFARALNDAARLGKPLSVAVRYFTLQK